MTGSEGLLRRRAGAQRRAGAAGEDEGSRWRSREYVCRAGGSANSRREHGQLCGGVSGYDDSVDEAQVGRLSGLAAGHRAPMFSRMALVLAHVTPACMSRARRNPDTKSEEAVDSTVSAFTPVS